MLISHIYNLGKASIGDKTKYEVLVDTQKDYKKQYLILAEVDTSKKDLKLSMIEYDYKNRYDYARGLISGSGNNLSLSININWEHMKDEIFEKNYKNETKIVNLSNKIGNIIKKINLEEYKNTYVEEFFAWIYPNGNYNNKSFILSLRLQIIDYLKAMKIKFSIKKDLPSLLVFGFNDIKKNKIIYSGKLKEFRRLYIELYNESVKKSRIKSSRKCYICGNESSDLEAFNWGIFTLDKISFNIGFLDKKNQNQYHVCIDCRIMCEEGLNVLENKLKFYAFSIKKGSETIGVYHYLIPNCIEIDNLRENIDILKNMKSDINLRTFKDISRKIEELNYKIERANRSIKKKLMNKKRDLEKKIVDYRDNKNILIDITDLFSEYSKLNLSFIDLYFRNVDLKQSPPTKEIYDVYFISKTRLEELAKKFKEIKRKHNIKNLYLWHLKDLIGPTNYFRFLEALYNDQKINVGQFIKNSYKSLKESYKKEIFAEKKAYFHNKINEFTIFYNLFRMTGLIT